jgi:hypothetical protein
MRGGQKRLLYPLRLTIIFLASRHDQVMLELSTAKRWLSSVWKRQSIYVFLPDIGHIGCCWHPLSPSL